MVENTSTNSLEVVSLGNNNLLIVIFKYKCLIILYGRYLFMHMFLSISCISNALYPES